MNDLQKIPPHDEGAEVGILASILSDQNAARLCFERLNPDDFYVPRYQLLFDVMRDMSVSGKVVELTSLRTEIARLKIWERIGGSDTISAIVESHFSPLNLESYIQTVLNARASRAALASSYALEKAAQDGDLAGAEMVIQHAIETIRQPDRVQVATAREVNAQIEDEIAGRRYVLEFPGWPALTSTFLGLPGAVSILCGRGGTSKSLFSVEPCWRWVLGSPLVDAAVLALESGGAFHMRRIQAQIGEWAMIADPRWCRDHPDEARKFQSDIAVKTQKIEECQALQYMKTPPTPSNLMAWLRRNSHRRFLVIDPISLIDVGDRGHIGQAQRRFLTDAKILAEECGFSLMLINHPAKNQAAGKPVVMGGSQALENFSDVVLTLEAVKPVEKKVRVSCGRDNALVNRILVAEKIRGPRVGLKIGYWFNAQTLRHEERGWIVEE